jgi:thiosulfate/3-mercaptopyruvate sulfurtransferase
MMLAAVVSGVDLGPQVSPPETREALTVTASWLADHLADPNLVILHVGDPAGYRLAHVPGARLAALVDFYAAPDTRELSVELPTADRLRRTLQDLGVSDDSTIVVYCGRNWYAPTARVIFTLTAAGLGAQTRLLDGGMPAWVRAGHPTTAGVPKPRKGKLSPLQMLPLVVDAEFVRSRASAPSLAIVDARARPFYDGEARARRDSELRGHIPGALNVPYTDLFDETGTLRPADELAALFAKAGIEPGQTVLGYCHAGLQATAMLFAARTLGHRVLLYDGSIEDWALLRNLPLETSGNGGDSW